MRGMAIAILVLAGVSLSGCLAKTVIDVATLPVDMASKSVDLATTSQSEADEARGREIRRREEKVGQLEQQYNEQREKCREGNRNACREASSTYAQIQQLLPTIPYEPKQD